MVDCVSGQSRGGFATAPPKTEQSACAEDCDGRAGRPGPKEAVEGMGTNSDTRKDGTMTHSSRWLACFALLMILVGTSNVRAAADPGGFAGLAWTRPEADCKKFMLCSEQPLAVSDAIPQETIYSGKLKTISGIPVRDSSFTFHEKKFYMGTAFFDPEKMPFEELKSSLVKSHGQPKSVGPRGAAWLLGNTRVILYKGESYHSVSYAHIPGFAKVAKLKNYPVPAPPPAKAAPSKKK
jgi:hypothetical protein